MQFFCAYSAVVSYWAFILSLFLPHLYCLCGLCFMAVAFPGFLHLLVCLSSIQSISTGMSIIC